MTKCRGKKRCHVAGPFYFPGGPAGTHPPRVGCNPPLSGSLFGKPKIVVRKYFLEKLKTFITFGWTQKQVWGWGGEDMTGPTYTAPVPLRPSKNSDIRYKPGKKNQNLSSTRWTTNKKIRHIQNLKNTQHGFEILHIWSFEDYTPLSPKFTNIHRSLVRCVQRCGSGGD